MVVVMVVIAVGPPNKILDSYDRDDGKLKLKLQCHADGQKLMATKEGSRGPLCKELAVGGEEGPSEAVLLFFPFPFLAVTTAWWGVLPMVDCRVAGASFRSKEWWSQRRQR